MWLEVILSRDDLAGFIREALPLTIHLGGPEHADQWFALTDPGEVTLLADRGLRVACKAKLCWPVLGIAVPITLHSLVVVLEPEIARHDGGHDELMLGLHVEHADFAGIPALIDAKITDRINAALVERRADMAWRFADAIGRSVPLPAALAPIEALDVEIAWGKLKITDEALVMAVSFHHAVRRAGEPLRFVAAPAPNPLAPPAPTALAEARVSDVRPWLIAIAAGALGGALIGAWVSSSRR